MLYPATIYALMLLVPGYLWLRSVGLPRAYALCCAPIISSGLVGVLGEVYARLHVAATPVSIYLPLVVLPLVLIAATTLQTRKTQEGPDASAARFSLAHPDITWWMPLVFVLVGLFICDDLFASELPSLDAVVQRYDVQHHLNATRAMADAQRASSLGINFYQADIDKAIMPFGRGTFYPAVWYAQCALLMQATGISTPVALNVALFVTMGIAWPLGMCALASSIFKDHKTAVLFCAPICTGFVIFPWAMLLFGPLYPNLVGFALLPASATLCMHAFLSGPSRPSLALAWGFALLSLLGLALLHPNTVFSAYLILIPFVAQLVYTRAREHGFGLVKALAVMAGFLVLCLAFWVLCYKAPFFDGVLRELWPYYAYPWQEVINILSQTYTLFFFGEYYGQILLGTLVIIGWIRQAYDKPIRWLAASYLIVCGVCFINATSPNSTLKRFIAGFWYTDAMRVSAMAIIVAALLAAFGLDWVYCEVCHILEGYNARLQRKTHPRLVIAVLMASFYLINFMPGFNWPGAHSELSEHITEYRIEGHEYDSNSVKTTFGDYKNHIRKVYKAHSPIDLHEEDFLREVKALVGSELVINTPCDGSTLAYGMQAIRVYYRKVDGAGGQTETPQSVAIRQGLNRIAEDAAVQQAVSDIGARYVLILDDTYSDNSFLNLRGNLDREAYAGISSITPDTPGFTEVLVNGACHLYRIEGAAE